MNILTIDNITKSYGVRKIFDGASFSCRKGKRPESLVLRNRKSTLLKMIARVGRSR